ncbi:MAG: cation:proton antiporter [Deltaproteobacteria bacterium]|nr:cation:proton antiporter [Deltaproteobacteria bacterium]
MTDISLMKELAIIFAVAVGVVLLLGRLHMPPIAGFLVSGVVVGPAGLGLVKDIHAVEMLAEVGVVLLLFTIGLEFSLERLRRIWKLVVLGGGVQVAVTIVLTALIVVATGQGGRVGTFYGFLVALSSTAIVLRALAERDEVNAPHGRFIMGILIFQDLMVVPMMLVIPMLGGVGGDSIFSVVQALGKAAVLVVAVVAFSRLVVPPILSVITREGKRELFLLAILLVVIFTAWLTSMAGLSLALGAFLAGMVLADSEYAHQALADVLPFRDTFTSLFFISVGMLLDWRVLVETPGLIVGLFLGVLLLKFGVAYLAALLMRFPARVAIMSGMGLAQVGEFSFVLAQTGKEYGLMNPHDSRVFIAASVMTMLITPLLVRMAPHFAAGMTRMRNLEHLMEAQGADEEGPDKKHLSNHVVVVGYGLGGRTLAKALSNSGIPYAVLDLNPDNVRKGRETDVPIFWGDVTSVEVLAHMRVRQAREVVFLISDPDATLRAVSAARRYAPEVSITVRSHYMRDVATLRRLGANDIVVEEFESGVEILARMLRKSGIPRNVVAARIGETRDELTEILGPVSMPRPNLGQVPDLLWEVKMESYMVGDHDWAVGKTIMETDLRKVTQVSIVALRRKEQVIPNPAPDLAIQPEDIVYLIGGLKDVTTAMIYLALGYLPETETYCAVPSQEDKLNNPEPSPE